MKSLNKNANTPEVTGQFATVVSMQQQLAFACLRQGLKLTTTIGREEGAALPYLQYAIAFNSDEPTVFHGQARSAQEPHYAMMFELINGKMVNEVFPPTIRSVKMEPEEGSNTPVEVPVSYWKRRLVVEHDITTRDPDPKASQSDGLHKVSSKAVWVGYDTKQKEIIRVEEGNANENPENVDRVQYMEVGPLGMVVVVIFKDTKVLTEGQQGTFAEGLKTAMAGFAEGGQTEGGADISSSSGAGMAVMSGLDVSLASSETVAPTSAAVGISPVSKLDLSKMAVKPDSELKKAISRLAGVGKKQPTIDIPKTIKVEQLMRSLGVVEHALFIRMVAGSGVQNPMMSTRLNQKQAQFVAEKFGYKVTLLGEGGASSTTTKAPVAKKAASRASAPVKKPAAKRIVRSKPQSND